MKFIALTAFIAVASAQDEAAEPLEANADCSAEGSTCGDGLCCGTATGVESEAGAGDAPETKVVCSASDAVEWVDEADPDLKFTFACNGAGEEGSASQLAASAAALLTSAYLLA
tara:strand:+ start:149 stop:490 length:342 start_codon:yes stop_codon:yes gene_type:complete